MSYQMALAKYTFFVDSLTAFVYVLSMKAKMKINDKVKGLYYNAPFYGVITGYDSARAYVDLCSPIEVFGTLRERVAVDLFNPSGEHRIELVESGEEVDCIFDAENGGVMRTVRK